MARFPEKKSSVYAWLDTSYNLGLTLGPVLGTLMYEAGGFSLPFLVIGSATLLSGALVLIVTEVSTSTQ